MYVQPVFTLVNELNNLQLPWRLAVVALFCFTEPRKKLEVDFTDVKKTEKALLSYFLAIDS